MNTIKLLIFLCLSLFSMQLISQTPLTNSMGFYMTSKPLTRWWWFSGIIDEETIRYQLDWAKNNNFGGVEIAFVYPLLDSKPGPKWLSPEWSEKCKYAKKYAEQIGFSCDFTFGTVWPLGGSIVSEKDASKVFGGLSAQRMEKSWELNYESKPAYVLNHLDKRAFQHYAEKVGAALKDALNGKQSAIFCDSWEVETDKIWTDGFDKAFINKYNYDIVPYMHDINKHPDERYDYRKLVADFILNEFYIPFTEEAHSLGAFSRVQCHGSPTDLIASYSVADVPETEAILYEPAFSVIPASAAALSSKQIVSSESFTCLYGWKAWRGPSPFEKKEQAADMKLVADALFANGVNLIVWHGMPYNPKGGNNEFYATVHVGPDSYFADEIPAFNNYMAKVSNAMKQGRTYSDAAVYFPLEDIWMADTSALEGKNSGVDVKSIKMPKELKAYHPLWISGNFLKNAKVENGKLVYGEAAFNSLYIDTRYIDPENIKQILRIAKSGLPVCFKNKPMQAGKMKAENYETIVSELLSLPNVSSDFNKVNKSLPLLKGENMTDYWCRVTDNGYTIFFSNPKANGLKYPLKYRQSLNNETVKMNVEIKMPDNKYKKLQLSFEPYQSILIKANKDGNITFEDIEFKPLVRY